MSSYPDSSNDVTRCLEVVEENISLLRRENEALQSQVWSATSIATSYRNQYRRDTAGLNHRLDLEGHTTNGKPLFEPIGIPNGLILEPILEDEPLMDQRRQDRNGCRPASGTGQHQPVGI